MKVRSIRCAHETDVKDDLERTSELDSPVGVQPCSRVGACVSEPPTWICATDSEYMLETLSSEDSNIGSGLWAVPVRVPRHRSAKQEHEISSEACTHGGLI